MNKYLISRYNNFVRCLLYSPSRMILQVRTLKLSHSSVCRRPDEPAIRRSSADSQLMFPTIMIALMNSLNDTFGMISMLTKEVGVVVGEN